MPFESNLKNLVMNSDKPNTPHSLPDLSFLRVEMNESFTDSVMLQISNRSGQLQPLRLAAKTLYWAAAASILLFLGITILEYGTLNLDNILGLGGYNELEMYQYLETNNYEY